MTIPANQIVNVIPGVISAGGSGFSIVGLLLKNGSRVPLGTVASFSTAAAVQTYFGAGTKAVAFANQYFLGFNNATQVPGSLLMAECPQTAAAAYIRGGSVAALTLTQLQAISGSLNIVVDGYPRNGTVNLSAATSPSNAATIIQTALNSADPTEAVVTGALGSSFNGYIVGYTLTANSPVTGLLSVGDAIGGVGVLAGTVIVSYLGGSGGAGTYTLNNSQTIGSSGSPVALTTSSNVLNVSGVASGTVQVGQSITGAGVTETIITALGTGTGGIGTYIIAGNPQNVPAESMNAVGTPVVVTYDSVSGGFDITSGYAGPGSSCAFATGSISATLMLTLATGAVLSQGSAAVTAATFPAYMANLLKVNSSWTTFTTDFDPDDPSAPGQGGNTYKQAIAAWKNTAQLNRYNYVCWDLDPTPAASVPAAASLGQLLPASGDTGTCLLNGDTSVAGGWNATTALQLAAFVMGSAASINFSQQNGRITFAAKSAPNIVGTVVDVTTADNLAGNPQVAGSNGNNYNFYGAYAQASSSFIWFQRGTVTGAFLWEDSYINQVWLNNTLQNALLNLEGSALSIPYSSAGNSLISQAMQPTISQGLAFGAYAPGTISASEAAAVNTQAGANVAPTLQAQGYFLQIGVASSVVRAARTSPPIMFWYLDRGSVQAITVNSTAVQ